MSNSNWNRSSQTGSTLLGLLLLGIGYVLGAAGQPVEPALAGVRETPPREAFKSGGARSEVVLQEISATLKRIETRVTAIERVATGQTNR